MKLIDLINLYFILLGPFSAALVNRFGFRWVVSIGCVISTASCFLTGLSMRWYQMILAYGVLGGIGFGMMYVSAIIVIGFYFERWRALASGISLCGAGIGSTCMPPLLSLVIKTLGWRIAFYILGAMCVTCVLCGLVFKPIKPVRVSSTGILNNYEISNYCTFIGSNRFSRTTKKNAK